jgi:uncharacterized protein
MTPQSQKLRQNEEEYFAQENADLVRQHRERLDAERAARAAAEQRAHFMKCPKCGTNLMEREFHHVVVDVCPSCKGMWFDRGELEMLGYVPYAELRRFYGGLFGIEHK